MGYKIVERDYKMFRFINSMRNGDADILISLFFNKGSAGRRRFSLLVKNGLLKKQKSLSPLGYSRFALTRSSYNLVTEKYPDLKHPCFYTGEKDFDSTHDRMVALSRVYLVKNNMCIGYKSERELAASYSSKYTTVHREFLPDGIFLNELKNKVGLEYELSVKSKKRLLKKIERHITIRDSDNNYKCLFVVKNKSVKNFLRSLDLKFVNVIDSEIVENWYKAKLESTK